MITHEQSFRPDGAILTGELTGPWEGQGKGPIQAWRIGLDFAFEEREHVIREIVIAPRHAGHTIVPGKRGGTINIYLVDAGVDPPELKHVSMGGITFPRTQSPYAGLWIIVGALVATAAIIAAIAWLVYR